MKFKVLVSDPPWLLKDALPGKGRGAIKHYPCMSLEALKVFPVPDMAKDSILFMWRLSSMVEEAYQLVRAWGFIPKTELVWNKLTVNGKVHFGMGRYLRASHETCIVATRGRYKVKNLSTRSTFDAIASREHSRKPIEFYELVESLCEGPYVEMFSRHNRHGWVMLGNQVPKGQLELPKTEETELDKDAWQAMERCKLFLPQSCTYEGSSGEKSCQGSKEEAHRREGNSSRKGSRSEDCQGQE